MPERASVLGQPEQTVLHPQRNLLAKIVREGLVVDSQVYPQALMASSTAFTSLSTSA